MPKQTRQRTVYNGIYFVELANGDKSFFIRYKQNGKSFEERAGRSSQGWNAEKASLLRKERLSNANTLASYTCNVTGELEGEHKFTFSVIFEAYLRLRPDLKGRENDIYRFRNYLKEDFGDLTPSEVVPIDIERFKHKLQKQFLKPATIKHVLELLRRLANYAFKKKFCSGLSFKIQMPTVVNQITENLTQEQLERLLKVLEEEPDVPVSNIVRLVLYSGLRRGEIFNLKWNDIDFYRKTITIRTKKKEKYVVIPMNEMAEKVLVAHAQSEAKSEFVFPGRGGKKRTECKRPLLRIKKNSGLPDDFRLLQGLRHVYASMLASSGEVDMETLQKLLAHKSPISTQRYAHLREYALSNSFKELGQEQILNPQDTFEAKTNAYDDESTDQDNEISFDDDFLEIAENKQLSEIVDQNLGDDHKIKTLEENERFEGVQTAVELEINQQETEYAHLDVDPIEMEVDLDEIVSAEELTEISEDEQKTEFDAHTGYADYANEKHDENEHLEEERIEVEAEVNELETEYVDVDPIKMEVNLDEIVSTEEFTEIVEKLNEYQSKTENKESYFIDELTAEILENEEKLEVEIDQEVYQAFSEEKLDKDSVIVTNENLILKEDFFTEIEEIEEITEISEEYADSIYAGETSEERIPSEEIDFQIKEEVVHNNYSENQYHDTHEVSDESIEASEGEFSEKHHVTQKYDQKLENSDIGYSVLEQQECRVPETSLDSCIQKKEIEYSDRNTELFDFIAESETEKNTSNSNETIKEELRVVDHSLVQDFKSEDDAHIKFIDNIEAGTKNGEKSVHIYKNTEELNLSEKKSGQHNVSRSTTYKNSDRHNSLKGVKIDFEFNPEKKEPVIDSASTSRSSITELKKELMSFSDLIKSTPTKLKSSTEVQNT